jgi:hypothetical protein
MGFLRVMVSAGALFDNRIRTCEQQSRHGSTEPVCRLGNLARVFDE